MREYLFRGKLINDINPQKPAGSWVYGTYVFWKHGACIFEANAVLGLYVDPETVGQYTGLLGKNGVKIFEWDIVVFTDEEFGKGELAGIVRVDNYAWKIDTGLWIADLSNVKGINIEIIGNKFDTPELLDGEVKEE
jgi:hypothetical protein